jgi:hypothetical protein
MGHGALDLCVLALPLSLQVLLFVFLCTETYKF